MNTTQQHFTLPSTVRRERDGGREYLVAPVTLIVPGVLQGSRGALFYPEHEVAKNARAWNGMPLTVGHPYLNGHPVAANTPGITHIGTVRNAGMTGGKLTGEAWIDVDMTRRVHPRLFHAVERGETVEVSTGLYTRNDPAPVGATYRGRDYTHIARDHRPDHLAILTDQRGACNTDHGCGINNHWGNAVNRGCTMPIQEIDWQTGEIVTTNCGCSEEPSDTPLPVIPPPYGLSDDLFDDDPPAASTNPHDIMPTTEIDWATGEVVTGW